MMNDFKHTTHEEIELERQELDQDPVINVNEIACSEFY